MVLLPCLFYQSTVGKINGFLPENRDFLCPKCKKGQLRYRDHVKRIMRDEGGSSEWLEIPRCQCDNEACRKIHRMLPDCLLPYKHYKEEVVSGVLDGIVKPDDQDSEDYPCAMTMKLWLLWFLLNAKNIEGLVNSIAYRELGYSEEVFTPGKSLFENIRRTSQGRWLSIAIRMIYNSGSALQAV